MAATPEALIHPSRIVNRWVQLIAGIIAMMAIANLQYAWTLFTKPIQAHLHVSLVAVQWTFTLFILLETWLVPFEGYLVDIIGPRLMLGIGSIFVALGWVGSGYAETITQLYIWYAVGGIGAGIVYGGGPRRNRLLVCRPPPARAWLTAGAHRVGHGQHNISRRHL